MNGGNDGEEDENYLKDLERAKRLSLEAYEAEQQFRGGSRKTSLPTWAHSEVGIFHGAMPNQGLQNCGTPISRPRPYSRGGVPTSETELQNTSQQTPCAIGFIPTSVLPPPQAFKRQRSLPHCYRSPHPPSKESSDPAKLDSAEEAVIDLISLASPKPIPKFSQNPNYHIGFSQFQVSSPSLVIPSQVPIPKVTNTSSHSQIYQDTSVSSRNLSSTNGNLLHNSGVQNHSHSPLPPPLPPTRLPISGTASSSLVSSQNPLPQTGVNVGLNNNLYKHLSDELKNDLIDLGQEDKHILDIFDPLMIKQRQQQALERRRLDRIESRILSNDIVARNLKPEEKPVTDTDGENRFSSASDCSTTSSFTFAMGRPNSSNSSLYPSLQDCQNGDTQDADDASRFYDFYDDCEYWYRVSSSASTSTKTATYGPGSIGFSNFEEPEYGGSIYASNRKSEDYSISGSEVSLRTSRKSHDKGKRVGKLYENIESIKDSPCDSEMQAFFEMVREVRFSCRHVDSTTNKGYIPANIRVIDCANLSWDGIKVLVWKDGKSKPFTCPVKSLPELLVDQSLTQHEVDGSARDYILRIRGRNEYLDADIPLGHYSYIQECLKLDVDANLILVSKSSMAAKSWARTSLDDASAVSLVIDDILPQNNSQTLTYDEISGYLGLIDNEAEKIRDVVKTVNEVSLKEISGCSITTITLFQAIKGVCTLLAGGVQTLEIMNSLTLCIKAVESWNSRLLSVTTMDSDDSLRRTRVGSDSCGRFSHVEIIPSSHKIEESLKDYVIGAIDRVEDAVHTLIEMYSKSFPVSFRMKDIYDSSRKTDGRKPCSDIFEAFLINVGTIHRLKPEWNYVDYAVSVEIFHGAKSHGNKKTMFTCVQKTDHFLFPCLVFDHWISFDHLNVCIIPRESRIVFTLYGRKPMEDNTLETEELGWACMQIFNFKGIFAQGSFMLPFWPPGLQEKRFGPAPNSAFSSDSKSPVLTLEFADLGYEVYFPEVPVAMPISRVLDTLDTNTQNLLKDIADRSVFTKLPPEEREVLWEKRHYLYDYPSALPKVLLAAQLWDWASLAELHALLKVWTPLQPLESLQFLLLCFPDARVRETCIQSISKMSADELVMILPQLVEALTYETFDYSLLARFILKKSLSCLKFSHALFWLLASQVGMNKWITPPEAAPWSAKGALGPKVQPSSCQYDPKRRRMELMLNSLLHISGKAWRQALIQEYELIQGLTVCANEVKESPNASRQQVLSQELRQNCSGLFADNSFPIPLSSSFDVNGIDIKQCNYYNSASLPLKVTFLNQFPDGQPIPVLFKVGDDLRQDMLTIQVIRIIEQWWLDDGLDLKVITFSCTPTGYRQGMVEMIQNAETLCRIQSENGTLAPFGKKVISEWLSKVNPSRIDHKRAIDNFTYSCAAYCILTNILGICDRHNDNIMITKRGHLFHIDFGKFLGDAQMFGNFKRDRTPFILTKDMVNAIADTDPIRFQMFVDICCDAFCIIRKKKHQLLNLFALLAMSGTPGVNLNSVTYVHKALLPGASDLEARVHFAQLIKDSRAAWFPSMNFFIHSMAQLRFGSEVTTDAGLLSFVQNIFTMEAEGRIESAEIIAYIKKYDPEKYYLFVIRVKRVTEKQYSYIQRSYKEFSELDRKLRMNFPGALDSYPLSKGSGFGRSNVKQVAEKRKFILQHFLDKLFGKADEIAHCNLVYTFFHPMLRDDENGVKQQADRRKSTKDIARNPSRICGTIKLSLTYKKTILYVLVLHAVDLGCLNANNDPPSPYVKTYLQPDAHRVTKRKTHVIRRNQHPSFMEIIEYRLPLEVIQNRTLQVSVLHHDALQENSFLGGVNIPLANLLPDKEISETYPLGNITSIA